MRAPPLKPRGLIFHEDSRALLTPWPKEDAATAWSGASEEPHSVTAQPRAVELWCVPPFCGQAIATGSTTITTTRTTTSTTTTQALATLPNQVVKPTHHRKFNVVLLLGVASTVLVAMICFWTNSR